MDRKVTGDTELTARECEKGATLEYIVCGARALGLVTVSPPFKVRSAKLIDKKNGDVAAVAFPDTTNCTIIHVEIPSEQNNQNLQPLIQQYHSRNEMTRRSRFLRIAMMKFLDKPACRNTDKGFL